MNKIIEFDLRPYESFGEMVQDMIEDSLSELEYMIEELDLSEGTIDLLKDRLNNIKIELLGSILGYVEAEHGE